MTGCNVTNLQFFAHVTDQNSDGQDDAPEQASETDTITVNIVITLSETQPG